MSLHSLIKKQNIKIDNHQQGTGQPIDLADSAQDVHIHKRTNYGKHKLNIRIPLNSNREMTITSPSINTSKVETRLKKEIREAFEDENTTRQFIEDVFKVMNSIGVKNDSDINAVLERIAAHLGIEKIFTRVLKDGTYLQKLISVTPEGAKYYLRTSKEYFEAGQISGSKMVYGKYLKEPAQGEI